MIQEIYYILGSVSFCIVIASNCVYKYLKKKKYNYDYHNIDDIEMIDL